MSKFDEMSEAASIARKNGLEFRDRCWQNLHLLVDGFRRYCEAPQGHCEMVPLNTTPNPGMLYNAIGASHFDPKDGYWYLGLLITLNTQRVLMRLALTERAGKVVVKTGTNDKPRELDLADEAQCRAFYDEIVEDIKRYFTAEPDFSETPSLRKIGFSSGS